MIYTVTFNPSIDYIVSVDDLKLGLVKMCIRDSYYFMLKKTEGLKYCTVVVGIIIVSAIINPFFSHKGWTLLFYLFTGNPVTLESIIYGLISAIIIGAMLLWFSTFNQVMGVERILGAIGKVLPNVSLDVYKRQVCYLWEIRNWCWRNTRTNYWWYRY